MAYRIEPVTNGADDLQRVLSNELEDAIASLQKQGPNRDEAIHDARKSLKKSRAILRILRPKLRSVFRTENKALREVGQSLSMVRDAAVLPETLDQVAQSFSRSAPDRQAVAIMRKALLKHKKDVESQADSETSLQATLASLNDGLARTKTWELDDQGLGLLSQALELNTRECRRAAKRAYKHKAANDFHELRKCLKDRWYFFRLLEPVWPEALGAYIASLHDVEQKFGEAHNLSVLTAVVNETTALSDKQRERLVQAIEKLEHQLSMEAKPIVDRLLLEKRRSLTHRLRHYWQLWVEENTNHQQPMQSTAA